MSSNNNDDIQDSILQSTQSQSHQQKEKEARRDAENTIRNFNYAKSIGRNIDGKEEEIKPLSSLAQRYLSNLAGNGDEQDDDDAAAPSTPAVTIQERKIDAVPVHGTDDNVTADNDAVVDNTTATSLAETTTNLTPNDAEDDEINDTIEEYNTVISAEEGCNDPSPSIIDNGERSQDVIYKDMSTESGNGDGEVDATLDSSDSDKIEASSNRDDEEEEEEEDDDDDDDDDDSDVLAAAVVVGTAVEGGAVVASTMSESEAASVPIKGDTDTTNLGDSSDVCQSIPENEAIHNYDNVGETDNDNMSTTCIDGEEELDEDEDEDETEYCGSLAGTIATGALAQQTNEFSDQSDHAVIDEESQVSSAAPAPPQNGDEPPAQSTESGDLLSEDETVGRPVQRWKWLLILCALALVAAVVAGMGVGVDRGLNHIDKASILIIPVPTQSPTSEPSLSVAPSDYPSSLPSAQPTNTPSAPPSISTMPSISPTVTNPPTLSAAPSSTPSQQPTLSTQPSSTPSMSPSFSAQPTSSPSESPTLSTQPTAEPSLSPSLSSAPSATPSASPTISTMPSASPSASPSTSVSSSVLMAF